MKKKKLSQKQTQVMINSRSDSASKFDEVKEGKIIIHRARHVECLVQDGSVYKVLFNKAFSLNVGDNIRFGINEKSQQCQLIEVFPRKNVLFRQNAFGERKEFAANIDIAYVMLGCQPSFYPEVLSQYHTILSLQGINCCFLLNKIDICEDLSYPHQDRFEYFGQNDLASYHFFSCHRETGLAQLKESIKGKTVILIGPSGVGKSSLVRKITKDANIKVGELSDAGYGCHTTSVTTMYKLGLDTFLIDSPGIRQMSLETLTLKELQLGFPDLADRGCRFRDCDHITSLGCQVLQDKELTEHFRYQDYCFLHSKFVVKHKDE